MTMKTPPSRPYYESRDIRGFDLTTDDVVMHEGQWRSVDIIYTFPHYDQSKDHEDLTESEKALLTAYLTSDSYVVAELRIESPGAPEAGRMLVPFRRYDLVPVQVRAGTIPD